MTTEEQERKFYRMKMCINKSLGSYTPEAKQRVIENRNDTFRNITEEEIAKLLTVAGFTRNSRSMHEYRMAKKIMFRGLIIDPVVYDRTIKMVIDYLGV